MVVPFANLQLEVRDVDVADQDLGLAYITSKLHWVECFITMLPKFNLYSAGETTMSGIIDEQAKPIAMVDRPLWNCARSTLANFEMYRADEKLAFEYSLPSDISHRWRIHQKGLGRHYELINKDHAKDDFGDDHKTHFVWKGSRSILDHLEDCNPVCHGNLKLLASDGIPLAAWKQQRDSKVLGSIHIFKEARDVLPVEVIVVSCLCIAIVEKCTGVTWFGGM